MKYLYYLLSSFCFILVTLCFDACRSDISDVAPAENFFLRDAQANVLKHVEPQILSIIHKRLVSEGRNTDASALFNTYNAKSGDVLANVKIPSDGGAKRATSFTVTQDGHSETIGWQNDIPLGQVVGTTGLGKRLEAFRIRTSPYAPGFYDSTYLQYSVYDETAGWQPYRNSGQVAGTTGMGRRIDAIKIYGNPNYSSFVFYRTHVDGLGWLDWVDNNQVSGMIGRRVEAFQFNIVVYDQP